MFKVDNSTGVTTSLNQTKHTPANLTKGLKFEFTATATDSNSRIRIFPSLTAQSFYIDKVVLIDLTKEKKNYRLLRIKGSIYPGTFIQTLTLREKLDTESD